MAAKDFPWNPSLILPDTIFDLPDTTVLILPDNNGRAA